MDKKENLNNEMEKLNPEELEQVNGGYRKVIERIKREKKRRDRQQKLEEAERVRQAVREAQQRVESEQ